MEEPLLYGSDYSVYARIARLALIEKGIEHRLVPVDVFAAEGLPDWYRQIHPFGRIPAFEHDGFRLFETSAITRYVDEGFDGPPLQPADPRQRARMNQIIALLDAYAYRSMVWDIYVETVSKPKSGGEVDEARVAAAVGVARTALETLSALKANGPFLLGDAPSLADLHAAPIFAYFVKAPVSASLMEHRAELSGWWERMRTRSAFAATEPTSG